MPGMSGDVDEHPASNSAAAVSLHSRAQCCQVDLHSKMIAIAINTMRTW